MTGGARIPRRSIREVFELLFVVCAFCVRANSSANTAVQPAPPKTQSESTTVRNTWYIISGNPPQGQGRGLPMKRDGHGGCYSHTLTCRSCVFCRCASSCLRSLRDHARSMCVPAGCRLHCCARCNLINTWGTTTFSMPPIKCCLQNCTTLGLDP